MGCGPPEPVEVCFQPDLSMAFFRRGTYLSCPHAERPAVEGTGLTAPPIGIIG